MKYAAAQGYGVQECDATKAQQKFFSSVHKIKNIPLKDWIEINKFSPT